MTRASRSPSRARKIQRRLGGSKASKPTIHIGLELTFPTICSTGQAMAQCIGKMAFTSASMGQLDSPCRLTLAVLLHQSRRRHRVRRHQRTHAPHRQRSHRPLHPVVAERSHRRRCRRLK